MAWILFPAAISAAVGLFLGRVTGAVEARHYPALPPVEEPPFKESLLAAGKFLIILVALNLALLFFIFTGPLYLILYYLVNGYLISRELFELVSIRRIHASAARAVTTGAECATPGLRSAAHARRRRALAPAPQK